MWFRYLGCWAHLSLQMTPAPATMYQHGRPWARIIQLSQSTYRTIEIIINCFKLLNFILFLNFYWSIVHLYCYVSFRCTAKWISYTYTYIHSLFFLDTFPIYAITEYWVEFPVLYSRFLLVIYFMCSSMYMSIPISQFIPCPIPW